MILHRAAFALFYNACPCEFVEEGRCCLLENVALDPYCIACTQLAVLLMPIKILTAHKAEVCMHVQ